MSARQTTTGNRIGAATDVSSQSKCCAELADRARHRLSQHSQFRLRAGGFAFDVLGDTLVVRGIVPSFYLKQLVQTVLRDLEGIRWIDNQVEVIASNGLSSTRGP
ncbi:MAG: hypothetical protein AB7G28_01815 [Pirellulales bacterium]